MTDVQFTEEQYDARPASFTSPKGLIALVQKFGLAHDDASAQKVLLIAASVALILAALVWWFTSPHTGRPLSEQEQVRMYIEAHPGKSLPPGLKEN